MRKLKLQVQMSVDGFVARTNGELDWMKWDWDDELKNYVNQLTDSADTILLGRKMTDGFISYWSNVKLESEEYRFAKQMVDYHKIVFTKTLDKSNWENTTLAKGDITDEVNKIKKQNSKKDIVVYGGAGFVSSLIKNNLIDEYNLFINPTAIGKGLEIFKDVDSKLSLKLKKSTAFDCGIVVNQYQP
ncbi:MAG: deaminase [Ignavibacteria bacterium GWA2_35_9]|nr:MAG: deaminase [Ignavibacteria bacterium GWA2_35_9]OGU45030.1 MAG: deaminase [Ignavibacteria bacterium GWB2_36_8]OGV22187.1 MAG: deaminase [Ignavibacteria bacterium RIFOXYA2_FULL_37_17]